MFKWLRRKFDEAVATSWNDFSGAVAEIYERRWNHAKANLLSEYRADIGRLHAQMNRLEERCLKEIENVRNERLPPPGNGTEHPTRVLDYLIRHGGSVTESQKSMAANIGMSQSTLSMVISELARAGRVTVRPRNGRTPNNITVVK